MFEKAVKKLNIIELIDSNTALRKLTATQKRHLECLVEGPTVYAPGQRLWRSGAAVDKAFIIIAGTVSFVPKRRHGGSSASAKLGQTNGRVKKQHETKVAHSTNETDRLDIGESMKSDAVRAVRELQAVSVDADFLVYLVFSYDDANKLNYAHIYYSTSEQGMMTVAIAITFRLLLITRWSPRSPIR